MKALLIAFLLARLCKASSLNERELDPDKFNAYLTDQELRNHVGHFLPHFNLHLCGKTRLFPTQTHRLQSVAVGKHYIFLLFLKTNATLQEEDDHPYNDDDENENEGHLWSSY